MKDMRHSRSSLSSWSARETTGSLDMKESPSTCSMRRAPAGVRSHAAAVSPSFSSSTSVIGNAGSSSVLSVISRRSPSGRGVSRRTSAIITTTAGRKRNPRFFFPVPPCAGFFIFP